MIRCIHYSNEGGTIEGVYFTNDLEMDAYDIIPDDCTLYNDSKIDADFPTGFPFDYNLEKS